MTIRSLEKMAAGGEKKGQTRLLTVQSRGGQPPSLPAPNWHRVDFHWHGWAEGPKVQPRMAPPHKRKAHGNSLRRMEYHRRAAHNGLSQGLGGAATFGTLATVDGFCYALYLACRTPRNYLKQPPPNAAVSGETPRRGRGRCRNRKTGICPLKRANGFAFSTPTSRTKLKIGDPQRLIRELRCLTPNW
jgi:hypothetical protein